MKRHDRGYETTMPLFDQPRSIEPNVTVEEEDRPRLRAQLAAMREEMGTGWHTATQLEARYGRRYSARLYDLQQHGIPHESERVSGGEWRFRLIGSPTNGLLETP